MKLQFSDSLETMGIESWAKDCLESKESNHCCWVQTHIYLLFAHLLSNSVEWDKYELRGWLPYLMNKDYVEVLIVDDNRAIYL